MFMNTERDAKLDALRRQLEEAEAQKAREQKEAERLIAAASRAAGGSHTRLTLALYDLLGVEPEHGTTRLVNGQRRDVTLDKDERIRSQRLYDIVAALVRNADERTLSELQSADRRGREERKPKSTKKAGPDAVAASTQTSEEAPGNAA